MIERAKGWVFRKMPTLQDASNERLDRIEQDCRGLMQQADLAIGTRNILKEIRYERQYR